jgi:hypothetical protein
MYYAFASRASDHELVKGVGGGFVARLGHDRRRVFT